MHYINLLAKFESKAPWCIVEYHQYLEQKLLMGKTLLESLRLALRPAIDPMVLSSSLKPQIRQIRGN